MLVLCSLTQTGQQHGQSRRVKLLQSRGVDTQRGLGSCQGAQLLRHRRRLGMGELRGQLKNRAVFHLRLFDLLRSAKVAIRPSTPLALIS